MAQQQPPISFIFRIDSLLPIDPSLGSQRPGDPWRPPDELHRYRCTLGNWYRWKDGVVTLVPSTQVAWLNQGTPLHTARTCTSLHRTATIFYQHDAREFLAVEFDAQQDNVRSNPPGWHRIGFAYDRDPRDPNRRYSYLHVAGDEPCLPAPGSSLAIQQLFPESYHYDPHSGPNPPINSAGVIGQLPLLLALAAFSRTGPNLHSTLTNNLRKNTWHPYPSGTPHGRECAPGFL